MKAALKLALGLVCLLAVQASAGPQYICFNFVPIRHWHPQQPCSFTTAPFEELHAVLKTRPNPHLEIGLACAFSYLNGDLDVLAQSLRNLLQAAQQADTPLLVTLDGQNWWTRRPDLWNWWDPSAAGYNPANVYNVEWTGWSPKKAIKIAWRNWGRQIRVVPPPNLMSRRVLAEHFKALKVLVPILREWYEHLPPEQKHLFIGVKLGWEASIGYNAFYYPNGNSYLERWPHDASHDPTYGLDLKKGLSGGLVQLGYAAVTSAGRAHPGPVTRDDLAYVVHLYLELLARKAHYLGLPKELIFVHQGGTYEPYDVHMPFDCAFNDYSIPGWSFYWRGPRESDDLAGVLQRAHRRQWCVAESWWPGRTAEEWRAHFASMLTFAECRFVAVYNWNQHGFKDNEAGIEGLRELVASWPLDKS